MKKGKMIWLAVIAALVLVPAMAWAQAKPRTSMAASEPSFMVEIYLGGGAASKSKNVVRNLNTNLFANPINTNFPGNIDPYFLAGLKFGYWFTPYGTYGISSLPDWMKYFGFYTDFSYHKLTLSNQTGGYNIPFLGVNGTGSLESNGNLITLAFMFAGRYGFLPDSEVPFGRLQPYIAVGPALFWSNQRPTINTIAPLALNFSPRGQDSFNVGLGVETGLRFFCTRAISVELSFKYRYAPTSHSFGGTIPGTAVSYTTSSSADLNLFSGQAGVAYHS
jgi:hypothetical protein